MKLLRAHFENFRMLRDLELDFSSDDQKNLTVIRAANESGKTTILHALQWALYGDDALPDKGKSFQLHPIDWNTDESESVLITATVEFELTHYRKVGRDVRESKQKYRIIRSAREEVDGTTRRSASTVLLFKLNETGADSVRNPDPIIKDGLPPELREVFFTDGDRALDFIEANETLSTKRDRVQRAIQSLLGLGVIKSSIKHVRKSAAEVNKKVKKLGEDNELERVASKLQDIDKETARLEEKLRDARQQRTRFDEKIENIENKIAEVLKKGDKEKLQKEMADSKGEIARLDNQLKAATKSHSELFRGQTIAINLLRPVLDSAFTMLNNLYDQKKIPNTTIPVLQERLKKEKCICGESLSPDEPDGQRRYAHIQSLIEDTLQSDEVRKIITELYYGTTTLQRDGNAWLKEYRDVIKHRDDIQVSRDEAGRKYRDLEHQLGDLADTDIQALREEKCKCAKGRDRLVSDVASYKTKLDVNSKARDELEAKRDRLLRDQKKGAKILAELDIIQDVIKVLESSYKHITKEELKKVSDTMNEIFLEMIGADPDQGAIIRRAEISPAFDIIVYGPEERTLNPDRDLNGASRRALTLAFILALTKVSEVQAPNVIDTPLGMTSGFVRRSILRTTIRESAQLILFLTHDEILGCEEIIDEAAGIVFTITNPAHFPKMLVNNPNTTERKVIRCECNHNQVCPICERREDET